MRLYVSPEVSFEEQFAALPALSVVLEFRRLLLGRLVRAPPSILHRLLLLQTDPLACSARYPVGAFPVRCASITAVAPAVYRQIEELERLAGEYRVESESEPEPTVVEVAVPVAARKGQPEGLA